MSSKIYNIKDYIVMMGALPAPIVITDFEGHIKYVNEAFLSLTGYKSSYLLEKKIGKKDNILYSGEHGEAFYDAMWKEIKSGKSCHRQIKNKKKNGETYWQSVHIDPVQIIDEYGTTQTYFLSVIDDITKTRHSRLKLSAILETIGQEQSMLIFDSKRTLVEIVGDPHQEDHQELYDNIGVNISDLPLYNNSIIAGIIEMFDKIDDDPSKSHTNYFSYKNIFNKNIDIEVMCKRFNSNRFIIIIKDVTNSRELLKIQLGLAALESQIGRLIESKTNNKF